MKYMLLLSALVIGLATFGFDGWDPPPTECDPEEREVAGNIHTPCMRVLPQLVSVEYRVVMEYPVCREETVFSIPGLTPIDERLYISVYDGPNHNVHYPLWNTHGTNEAFTDGQFVVYANQFGTPIVYTIESDVGPYSVFGNPTVEWPNVHLLVQVAHSTKARTSHYLMSNPLPRPRTDAKQAMIYACQEQLRQEKADREHAADLAKQEAEQTADITAQRDADRLEQEQAVREAEAQARMAEAELAALLERKAKIAETELIKTQTLETHLKHQEVIAGILREIVRIRLAGEEDRARITNEYLVRMEAAAADFDVKTEEIEARIQAYLNFNDALLQSIETYQAEVARRLEEAQAQVAERVAELERIQQEAQDVAVDATEAES